ncbi:MAG: LLM class flavin-dependent oxidoreductase [Ktedonobacterales bacterium]|nr:LLM class flavin-dependent oxidoreductase [Ktedonobacterales bacterium]
MPVDFGWVVQPVPTPALEIADLPAYNRAAIESLSSHFTTVWVEDHLQWGDTPTLEVWTTLSYLAAAYPRLRVAPMVLGQGYRNPALTAKMAASLHYLSGGRFIMGIGAGWKEDEYRAYGYDFPGAGTRIGQLSDAIEIMRAMWTQSPATYTGKYFQVADAYCEPRPTPMIPIHVGGSGEKSTLRVVARLADAWNFGFDSSEALRHKMDVLRGHCEAVGRDFNTIQLTYYAEVDLPDDPATFTAGVGLTIGPTPAEAITQLRSFIVLGVSHILIRTKNLASLRRFVAEVAPALAQG